MCLGRDPMWFLPSYHQHCCLCKISFSKIKRFSATLQIWCHACYCRQLVPFAWGMSNIAKRSPLMKSFSTMLTRNQVLDTFSRICFDWLPSSYKLPHSSVHRSKASSYKVKAVTTNMFCYWVEPKGWTMSCLWLWTQKGAGEDLSIGPKTL